MSDVQIILGDGHLNSHDLGHIREAAAILLPQSCPLELYKACKEGSAEIFPNYDTRFEYPGKIGQALLFERLKCPHPETRAWASVEEFKRVYAGKDAFPHQIPFLIKANESHEAERIYLISDQGTLDASLEILSSLEQSGSKGFISQEMVLTKGNVLRAVIMGRRVITYWKRARKPGEIMSTISRGAEIDHDWRSDLQGKGRKEAELLSAATGINLAAVDLVFSMADPDPHPMILEINYYFGRRGLGGSLNYYRLLHGAIQEWLVEKGFDPNSVRLT